MVGVDVVVVGSKVVVVSGMDDVDTALFVVVS